MFCRTTLLHIVRRRLNESCTRIKHNVISKSCYKCFAYIKKLYICNGCIITNGFLGIVLIGCFIGRNMFQFCPIFITPRGKQQVCLCSTVFPLRCWNRSGNYFVNKLYIWYKIRKYLYSITQTFASPGIFSIIWTQMVSVFYRLILFVVSHHHVL